VNEKEGRGWVAGHPERRVHHHGRRRRHRRGRCRLRADV